jgi:transposase InsO family protein
VALRRRYPLRGPKKLRQMLSEHDPAIDWPAASTIGDWLKAAGLSEVRRRTRHVVPLTQPLAAAQAPNDVWTADFKGWFRTGDGTRCDPLTILDACSRFVLCCRITPLSGRGVRPWFERTFREYGLPVALRTDNGPPFASTGAGRLTQLAVWWLKLGIQVDRIDPGHPEQNGRHERFHLTLKQEATSPPAGSPQAQQRRFDRVRREFNYDRPHEALGQVPPGRLYVASPRPYPATVEDPWYDASHQVRRVNSNGQIKWQGDLIFVSEAMRRELVGIAETERGDWVLRFMQVELGRIHRRTRRFTPSWHGRRIG